jgi:hypothetical protein
MLSLLLLLLLLLLLAHALCLLSCSNSTAKMGQPGCLVKSSTLCLGQGRSG